MGWLSAAFFAVLKKFGIGVEIPIERTGYVQPMIQDSITLERLFFTDSSTIGEIRMDGDLLCKSLELSCRKANPDGKMAIPPGKYRLYLGPAPESPLELRFGFPLPLLLAVPGREGIRIHPANRPEELEGCIAPGMRSDVDVVYDSRTAFKLVVGEIQKRMQFGHVYIVILGGGQPNV